jgi:hypothetical protein
VCVCVCVSGQTRQRRAVGKSNGAVIHAYMHASPHAHMHTCPHAHMPTCTHAHMPTCTHAHMHTCAHAHMHTCAHAHTRSHTNSTRMTHLAKSGCGVLGSHRHHIPGAQLYGGVVVPRGPDEAVHLCGGDHPALQQHCDGGQGPLLIVAARDVRTMGRGGSANRCGGTTLAQRCGGKVLPWCHAEEGASSCAVWRRKAAPP